MAETLLSFSNVLLFGRTVDDMTIVSPVQAPTGAIQVALASVVLMNTTGDIPETLDNVSTKRFRRFFIKDHADPKKSGLYVRNKENKKKFEFDEIDSENQNTKNEFFIFVKYGAENGGRLFKIVNYKKSTAKVEQVPLPADPRHGPFVKDREGLESEVEQQLQASRDPRLARVYGFSFEGYYYDLPRPVIFLVHGEGAPASEARGGIRRARAPGEPSLTGIGQADFQFSDDIMVWSYDKADYTIRMDVETGMFEDVLLAAMLSGGPGGMDSAGMNARGMNARGMNARGMNARGMNARGMNARGGGNSD